MLCNSLIIKVVPETGLEPALVSQPDPKSGASTNSATQATRASAPMIPDLVQAANELSGGGSDALRHPCLQFADLLLRT